ncbi:hypothetical protein D0O09_20065 [Pseudomonas putida]|nr:hypothetical protein D0O09_20065 [Pseudomonas putida]
MDTNKMRAEFEAALVAMHAATGMPECDARSFLEVGSNGYTSVYTKAAWWAWQASREALVVDLRDSFPLLSAEGLSESDHHCEWSIQQDRKRLHAALDSAQGNANSEVGA